jgi:hypothetical protein
MSNAMDSAVKGMLAELDQLRRDLDDARRALQKVSDLAAKWNKDAVDDGFAMSEPAYELWELLEDVAPEVDTYATPPHSPQPDGSITTVEAGEMDDSPAAANAGFKSGCLGYAEALHIENYENGRADGVYVVRHMNDLESPVAVYLAPAAQEPQGEDAGEHLKKRGEFYDFLEETSNPQGHKLEASERMLEGAIRFMTKVDEMLGLEDIGELDPDRTLEAIEELKERASPCREGDRSGDGFDMLAARELAKSFKDNPREASLEEQEILRKYAALAPTVREGCGSNPKEGE